MERIIVIMSSGFFLESYTLMNARTSLLLFLCGDVCFFLLLYEKISCVIKLLLPLIHTSSANNNNIVAFKIFGKFTLSD